MTSVICTSGLLILASVVMLLLRDSCKSASALIGVTLCVGIFAYLIGRISPLATEISSICRDGLGETGDRYIPILIKGLGISFLTSFTADTLRGLECAKSAEYAEAVGRVEITVLAFPLVKDILALCVALVK